MNKKIIKQILTSPFLWLLYFLSGLIKRRNDVWVFGSYQNTFSDNSKYLFVHVSETHPEIRAIWISGDKNVVKQLRAAGCRALMRWSPYGIFITCRAKFFFVSSYVSDINLYTSRKSVLINLWHGVPLKKIEYDIDAGPLHQLFNAPTLLQRFILAPHVLRRPEYVLSTSEFVSEQAFSSAFRIPVDRCLPLGYPRLDGFYKSTDENLKFARKYCSASLVELMGVVRKFKRVFLYAPTWRDANPSFVRDLNIDFGDVSTRLRATNGVLLVKLHPNTPPEDLAIFVGYENILLVGQRDDVYPLMTLVDVLITDYSSIYFDFLLLDREIVFYAFDMVDYFQKSRRAYFDYDAYSPGRKIFDAEGLLEILSTSVAEDSYRDERANVKNLMFNIDRTPSAERIVSHVIGNLFN